MTHPFIAELLDLLERNHAVIRGTCQSGCDLVVEVNDEEVGEFCCQIPDSPAVIAAKHEYSGTA